MDIPMRSLLGSVLIASMIAVPAAGQTATSTKGTETAYGARLSQPEGVEVNSRRINSRVNNRVNSRLSTRLQRYVPIGDALAPLRATAGDQSGKANVIRPVPQAENDPN
jgi:hypothetical protein